MDALNTISVGDQELIDYVQMIVGLAAIGKVYVEALLSSRMEKDATGSLRSGMLSVVYLVITLAAFQLIF